MTVVDCRFLSSHSGLSSACVLRVYGALREVKCKWLYHLHVPYYSANVIAPLTSHLFRLRFVADTGRQSPSKDSKNSGGESVSDFVATTMTTVTMITIN